MATVPIWKRGHLNVNDPTAFPIEYLKPSAEAGYAVVQVHINPKHPSTTLDQVPLDYIRLIKSCGMQAWGFVWADAFASPDECFNFVRGWRQQSLENGCALTGFVINCEDAVEARDQAGESWSWKFTTAFRNHALTRKLSLALNTYNGCGGISLPAWMNKGARLYCQTFHEGNTHEWPMDSYIQWAKYYGYTKVAMMKPHFGTYKPFPNQAEQIEHAKWAGTVGMACWYAEGGGEPKNVVIPLIQKAREAGVCY